ncbi:hypothetical protein LTR05_007228 [Lithohypha guttulata]|uniref:Vacuolar protein sorting-associated protein 51 homolog n=1 Tax=Lithohypha guttulata TaxID=1690604 RepID=A0AAN7SUP0_9EURO|nr:hypothetical protein LTR05_007228 [Lithohypha guttulata]
MATITSPRTQSPASSTPRIKSPSIAETPTSSTRGSFDLPLRSSTAAGGPPPQRKGNRTALRDYYNLKSKPQSQLPPGHLSRTASITSTTSDLSTAPSTITLIENGSTTSTLTAQLDDADFDVQTYINDLLATSSLKEILKVEATLVSEIRNLDGERKALVYDNYSKLIKAVGTIGEMQRTMNQSASGLSEVGKLEGKMEGLREVVRVIGQQASDEKKNAAEEGRRARKAAKEQQKKRELVRWILDAPNRLRDMLDNGQLDEARKDCELVQKYLDRWKGVGGVEEVRQACTNIMATAEQEHKQSNGES